MAYPNPAQDGTASPEVQAEIQRRQKLLNIRPYYDPEALRGREIDEPGLAATPVSAPAQVEAPDPAKAAAQAAVDAQLKATAAEQAGGLLDKPYTGIPKEVLVGGQRRQAALYPLSNTSPLVAEAQKQGLNLVETPLDKAPAEVMNPELRAALEAAKSSGGPMPTIQLLRLDKKMADRFLNEWKPLLEPAPAAAPQTQAPTGTSGLPPANQLPAAR